MNAFEIARQIIVDDEVARLDKLLKRKLRPGKRIAIGGARIATIGRTAGACDGYVDTGFRIAGRPVCAMAGCHRRREDHG